MTSLHPVLAALFLTFSGLSAYAAPAITGPSAADVRPGPHPIDVRSIALPKGVERAWLQKDADMIWQVRKILPPDASAPAFVRALQALDSNEIDLGYGYKRHTAALGGGYSSCFFTAASHDGALLSLRVECQTSGDKDAVAAIVPTIDQAFGNAFIHEGNAMTPHLVRVAYQFPAATTAAEGVLEHTLGALQAIDSAALPPAQKEAYELLMSPLDELALGTSCGVTGQSPHGQQAITVLQSANRIDLLRNVLRGPNPEARIYAARALGALHAMRAEEDALVKTLAALPITVEVCSGCLHRNVSSAEAFRSSKL